MGERVRLLAKLKIELDIDSKDLYKKSSLFQGFLFENIDTLYAEKLHEQKLHPYSQYICCENEKMYWCINTLNNEAYEKIILKLVDDISEINLKRTNEIIKIQNKEIKTIEKKELITEFNNIDGESYINFSLLTPMAFKQRGRYVGYPDLRLIYQSIMNKYSAASQEMIMIDEDVLEQMVDNSNITKFFVKSKTFPLEGINIAGAVGNIRIKISGPDLMKRYARLLFRFSEFSGIGVKTGIGMGAIKLNVGGNDERKRDKDNNRKSAT